MDENSILYRRGTVIMNVIIVWSMAVLIVVLHSNDIHHGHHFSLSNLSYNYNYPPHSLLDSNFNSLL